jgi:hypothetical protein
MLASVPSSRPRSCTTYDYSSNPSVFGGNSIGCTIQPIAVNTPGAMQPFHRLRVSLILGAEGVSSDAAMTGGLVASGEGTWSVALAQAERTAQAGRQWWWAARGS